ncbi:hypothetical protein BDY21DRAFT_92309 [Lineolata rhizophorae]|uniref:Uncharacterized protein n=1 Tax=Lineolata rhizophorae TaxID=578093 RepID=A0A6A6PCJ9_9PEZI|nr:hypothetical protein BDY21DRAFT_92309 [Lineolata rhizophorae]
MRPSVWQTLISLQSSILLASQRRAWTLAFGTHLGRTGPFAAAALVPPSYTIAAPFAWSGRISRSTRRSFPASLWLVAGGRLMTGRLMAERGVKAADEERKITPRRKPSQTGAGMGGEVGGRDDGAGVSPAVYESPRPRGRKVWSGLAAVHDLRPRAAAASPVRSRGEVVPKRAKRKPSPTSGQREFSPLGLSLLLLEYTQIHSANTPLV